VASCTLVAVAKLAVDQQTLVRSWTSAGTSNRKPQAPPIVVPRTLFVFLAGLEGTGHHLYEKLYQEESTKLKDIFNDGEIRLRDDLTKLQFSLYNDRAPEQALFSGHLGYLKGQIHVNGTMIFDSIVQQLRATNRKVLYWLDKISIDSPWRVGGGPTSTATYNATNVTFPIPLNGLSARGYGMMSYPNYLLPSRPLQYPDLHLLYRACVAANVSCGHVYLHRDPAAIIGTYTLTYIYACIHQNQRMSPVLSFWLAGHIRRINNQLTLVPGPYLFSPPTNNNNNRVDGGQAPFWRRRRPDHPVHDHGRRVAGATAGPWG
jgi:hypothetical protein